MHSPFELTGPAIITRYLGPTDHRDTRITATHRRDSERTYRATVTWNHAINAEANHRAAAEACLARCAFASPMALAVRGSDHATYVWVAVPTWQLEPLALALAACRELTAAAAGGASAEALALPLALARQALGLAPYHPTVDGWALEPGHPGPVLLDIMGRPIDGLEFAGDISAAGALAAAAAAGWQLTAPALATARKLEALGQAPNPAAVAQAITARGGCPAAVAALTAAGEGVAQ